MDNPTIVVITDRNDLDDQLIRYICSIKTAYYDKNQFRPKIETN